MSKRSDLFFYLTTLFLFKIAVGAILLAVGWDSLTLSHHEIENICIMMALSFLPAAFSKPLTEFFSTYSIHKILLIFLITSAVLIMVEYFFMNAKSSFVFLINFILWIVIFLTDATCEKWYIALAHKMQLSDIRKMSGLSMTIGQFGVILGPALVLYLKNFNHMQIYISIMMLFLLASAPIFISNKRYTIFIKNSQDEYFQNNFKKFLYIIAYALIWPTLVVFNISAPIVSKTAYHSMNIAGSMEILIGLGSAFSGIIHTVFIGLFKSDFNRIYLASFLLIFLPTLIYFFNNHIVIMLASTFGIGIVFGYLRIELRAYIARFFNPKVGGSIIAFANSISAIFVAIYAFLFYVNSTIQINKSILISFPLCFIVVSLVYLYVLIFDKNNI